MSIAAQLSPQLLAQLTEIVGESRVKTDASSLEHWGKDYTKHFEPNPSVIVFPSSTEQVQQIVQFANTHQIAITPSGGRTGLSAGAVATNGEIVVSLDKMNQVLDFFPADRMVRIQAGVVTEQLQEYAESKDMYYPVDFASAGSSQMGGNIATNAGGIKVIKYGMTRNWVLGLTVVTGKGDILHLNKGMIKNATGYALQHLFIGGEGTLGIVTEAEIKLERKPHDLQVMVLGVPDFDAVMPILHAFQSKIDLTAFEFFGELAMQKVLDHGHVQRPFDTECPFYVLVEFEAPYEPIMDTAMEIFEHCMEEGWVLDGVLSQSLDQVESLWRLREDISESIAPFTPYKNDISVLITHVPAFIKEIEEIVEQNYPDFEICWFGHIGDGNLHLNILKPENLDKDDFFAKCKVVNEHVFNTVQKYDGSISAEHGVGMTKKPYLAMTRSPEEIEYMKALKQVFDPNSIMNPGKLFD
ncbi:FAD-binding oxidoreductase [Acinetobacter pollinis]|uniref:FAD-binding oxidoreductase n=1 Tax=Acinetobacter pollinis TaxID=2605270 RepID=UPI0018A30D41|nr:FAD-binding oxidoreductase [Acinetobacter pollinis]MBF7689770.1 FAD-binding oxidoreductase [Acinetobacter pollinis]MBF7692274.1 FAD-binding oxidoreductase [Acinetobacter pollinis]MBF7697118.1 FAD-binding oxidoreductase [Acinetobacter pollinis]MBF7700169.1 FAD-binding oxidoreductase [Acinetobacter pollinis]